MPRNILALAVLHAAGESVVEKLPPDTHGALLAVPDEAALRARAEKLKARGLRVVEIVEDGGPYVGQLLALGVTPGPKMLLKPHFGGLPCLREEPMRKT